MFWATPPENGPVPPEAVGDAAGLLIDSGACIMAMCGLLSMPAAKFAAIGGRLQGQGHMAAAFHDAAGLRGSGIALFTAVEDTQHHKALAVIAVAKNASGVQHRQG
jgi:hypothetical protein